MAWCAQNVQGVQRHQWLGRVALALWLCVGLSWSALVMADDITPAQDSSSRSSTVCAAGTFSFNGVEPCSLCAPGTFSSSEGATGSVWHARLGGLLGLRAPPGVSYAPLASISPTPASPHV